MILNSDKLLNKRILVTGGTAGLGAHLAIEIAKCGGIPIILGRDQEKLNSLLVQFEALQLTPPQFHLFDLTEMDQLTNFVDQSVEVDGLILSAGVNDKTTVKFISSKKIDKIFDINFTAQVQLIQQLIKKKKFKKGASVLGISSLSVGYISATNSLYSASKSALEQFLKTLAIEHAPEIRVNIIRPGLLNSKMASAYDFSENMDEFVNQVPMKRMGEFSDIHPLAMMLLSDESSWITGAVIPIDGGTSI
jgi:NAD(P)-dependent dehydrogenase (short-subunit alcohol dehydrogenase family)